VGDGYALDVIVDDSINEQPEVYREGGNHATSISLDCVQIAILMAEARHRRFGVDA
jgi:Ala-tRNA(Pro) deacylase